MTEFDARAHTTARFALEDTRTHDHLRAGFAADTQAAELLRRFARIAEIEGFPEIARAFRELAETRAVVARGHLDFLMRGGDPLAGAAVGATDANLRAALAFHAGDGLLEQARTADAEGFADIASWFHTVERTRQSHAARLAELLRT